MLILDPDQRISARKALESEWLSEVNPETIQPPKLPSWQDCHELWLSNRDKKPCETDRLEGPSPFRLQDVRYPVPGMYNDKRS